jgi:hexosaminidase
MKHKPLLRIALAGAVLSAAALFSPGPAAAEPAAPPPGVVPAPAVVQTTPNVRHLLTPATAVFVPARPAEAREVGGYLADLLRPATGYPIPVLPAPPIGGPPPGISLLLSGADPRVGREGYQLDVTAQRIVIRATTPAGLFAGVQTLRQLLPADIERRTRRPHATWAVPGVRIVDFPRYEHRGAMLDVARHFFPVRDVQRFIDQIALYKINTLHLHLTDDQGWRLEIKGWPKLTRIGGATSAGGGPGGYYTQADYRAIVEYARRRFITVIPEIDGPAHSNAALASYAELNCDGVANPPYIDIGPAPDGHLCVGKPRTYEFLDQVIGQLAALTPGPYLHIGGDEAYGMPAEDYAAYMRKVERIVARHGKKLLGWGAALTATTPAASTGQFWVYDGTEERLAQVTHEGAKVVMSPCVFTYLDMKYAANVPPDPLGLQWAGFIEVADAYGWDPTWVLPGVNDAAVLGVEAPVWSETITNLDQLELMTFPRLPAVAEIGWSPLETHDLSAFVARLAQHGPRWDAMGVDYHRSPQVPWPAG